jgi:biopolymer transport protein ExbD
MRRLRTRKERKPAELMLVPMIDIFVVLVTFLLMTAVFSRITIMELDLPSSNATSVSKPSFRLEVIVRKEGLELTNGAQKIAVLPNKDGAYDLATLSEMAIALKRDYPDATAASVLLEPEIEYDHLIQVMDAIRSAEVPAAEAEAMAGATAEATTAAPAAGAPPADAPQADAAKPIRVALFTDIAVGDAP